MLQSKLPASWFNSIYLFVLCLNSLSFFFPLLWITSVDSDVLESRDAKDEVRALHGMNGGTAMTAAALPRWTGSVISSSAFNLSMQVLRLLTFTPCSSLLPFECF